MQRARGLLETSTPQEENPPGLSKVGHSLLSDPPRAYTEEDVRSDGRYAVLGAFGPGGSFLVDIQDPANPTEVHRLPSPWTVSNGDVKFDSRDGLYYRSQEGEGVAGIEVVDYGFEIGTPENPRVIASAEAGQTHNLHPHPDEPLVYATNEKSAAGGLDVWDVSDPFNPKHVRTAGPRGALHDVTVDTERDLLHLAYIGDGLDGYVIMNASNPARPEELGRFDYAGRPTYSQVPIGQEAFKSCHFATADPKRDIAVVGDEIRLGRPGGKHVFDIGWERGSPSNPVPLGYTLSPNAALMNADPDDDQELEQWQEYYWTGHNFDVVSRGDRTLLTSGDYHEGTVLYDITDPADPSALDQYFTVDKAAQADGPIDSRDPPYAWGADYNEQRDLVVTSDQYTGVYTFRIEDG